MDPLRIVLPERLTAQSVALLRAALDAVAEPPAIVLEGTQDCFCRGLDFSFARDAPGATRAVADDLGRFAECLALLLKAGRPTLAVVDGAALGGGLGLAAACDFVLATPEASFGLPEALYGFAPAIIRPALLTRLSAQKLNRLLFTCYARFADEALALGLVDQIATRESLGLATRRIVRQMGRARTPAVIAARRWSGAEIDRALASGVAETAAALSNAHVLQALRSVLAEEDFA